MSDHEYLPEPTEDDHRTADPARVHVIAAVVVAIASLAAAITIFVLAPAESGVAAAGAVATSGLALAGQLRSQSR